ncbi:hypothetical protein MUN82_03880 [Hymenobacter aerilatus]|uniref:Uncharacterized protein n=1 Tax=Hymenobacter aerilatus TaxID=2932251 RepID=A0A8T9SVZ3_9BACT|nr:hypothetical protein [Hymenobacter aerilatus]UOR06238.1 hypothetical protein MUN82_03880 [Hymenobacter aerilatus]
MVNSSELGEWVLRARQLQLTGASHATPQEIAAVHAGLFPSAEAVCETCPRKYGPAYFRIIRWLSSQPTSTSTPTAMAEQARKYSFVSDDTSYRPFGSPSVYNNANLTDAVAERLIKADPAFEKLLKATEAPVPTAPTIAEQTAELDKLKREELDALYTSEVPDSDPAKAFANKGELIAALVKYRATVQK